VKNGLVRMWKEGLVAYIRHHICL